MIRRLPATVLTAALAVATAVALAACTQAEPEVEPTMPPQATQTATPPPAGTSEASPTAAATSTETPEPAVDSSTPLTYDIEVFDVPAGARPHDVAPALDGGVWYTAQGQGALGYLDPATGEARQIALGPGSSPHGVIVGEDGDAWVTDSGLNAMVRVDAETEAVTAYPLPADRPNVNLNTAAFDGRGRIWFTGQGGVVGVLDPSTEEMRVFDAPRGRGPYGIDATPEGEIYFASLAGSYVGRVDLDTGDIEVLDPPTADQGMRRVWSDSQGRIWGSQWNAGQVSMYDPATGEWQETPLPGGSPRAYAVYVDELDAVWLSDFGGDAIHRFDPLTETFETFPSPNAGGNVRQILGRPGEVWFPESATDTIFVIRYQPTE